MSGRQAEAGSWLQMAMCNESSDNQTRNVALLNCDREGALSKCILTGELSSQLYSCISRLLLLSFMNYVVCAGAKKWAKGTRAERL